MKKTMTVRLLQEKDYEGLVTIENMIWTNDNSPILHQYDSIEQYKERTKGQTIFVATDGMIIHGFVSVHHPTPLPSHQKQWMLGIGVHPESQSMGVGKKLLAHLKTIAPEYDIHKLSLRVMGTNPKAIAFYKKNGFQNEGILKDEFFIDGHFCDDYLFAYFI